MILVLFKFLLFGYKKRGIGGREDARVTSRKMIMSERFFEESLLIVFLLDGLKCRWELGVVMKEFMQLLIMYVACQANWQLHQSHACIGAWIKISFGEGKGHFYDLSFW